MACPFNLFDRCNNQFLTKILMLTIMKRAMAKKAFDTQTNVYLASSMRWELH